MDVAAAAPGPHARRVGTWRSLRWLARGAGDFAQRPGASMFYGLCTVLGGAAILLTMAEMPYLFTAAVSGFVLLAPMLATGLYDLSRSYEREGPVCRLRESLLAWRANPSGFAGFVLVSLFIATAWQIVSVVIIALYYKGSAMEPLWLVIEILRNPEYAMLFTIYLMAGGLVASLMFALSVVAVPMLLDRKCGVLDAMHASIAAVTENPLPLAVWAVIIMFLNAFGFASALVGFIVVMPILGHASWHAYRDLIAD
jgi:uncharacterized membrane protein